MPTSKDVFDRYLAQKKVNKEEDVFDKYLSSTKTFRQTGEEDVFDKYLKSESEPKNEQFIMAAKPVSLIDKIKSFAGDPGLALKNMGEDISGTTGGLLQGFSEGFMGKKIYDTSTKATNYVLDQVNKERAKYGEKLIKPATTEEAIENQREITARNFGGNREAFDNPVTQTVGQYGGVLTGELMLGAGGMGLTKGMLNKAPWLIKAIEKAPNVAQALIKGGITGANVWGLKQAILPEEAKPGLKGLPTSAALWGGGAAGGEMTSQVLNRLAPQLSKIPGMVKVVLNERGAQTLQINPMVEGLIREVGENVTGTIAALPTVSEEERKRFIQEMGEEIIAEGVLDTLQHMVAKGKTQFDLPGKKSMSPEVKPQQEYTGSDRRVDLDTRQQVDEGKVTPEQLAELRKQKAFLEGRKAERIRPDAEKVYEIASKKQPILESMLDEVVKENNLQGYAANQKKVDSIVNKVMRKSDPLYNVNTMKDHTRGTVFLNDFSEVPKVLESLQKRARFAGEAFIETPLNQFGYRGINLSTNMGDGINGEVQIHTKESWELKRKSDDIYAKYRNVNEEQMAKFTPEQKSQYFKDMKQSSEMWESFWNNQAPEVREKASSSVIGLESPTSPRVPSKSTQEPLSNTNGVLPESIGRKSITLPDSNKPNPVNMIDSPPDLSIAQKGEKIKLPVEQIGKSDKIEVQPVSAVKTPVEEMLSGQGNTIQTEGGYSSNGRVQQGFKEVSSAGDSRPGNGKKNQEGLKPPTKVVSVSPAGQKYISKAGFKNAEEAHVAFEAKQKGKEWFKKEYSNIENSEAVYKELVEKTKKLTPEEEKKVKFDLQFFAMREKDVGKIAKQRFISDRSVSQFKGNTLQRAVIIPEDVKAELLPEDYKYTPEKAKEWQSQAEKNIATNRERVIQDIAEGASISGGVQAHEAAIISKQLLDEAQKTGDYSKFKEWTKTVASKTRETARALKGTDTAWEKTKSPEGAVLKAQKTVQKAKELWKELGGKGEPPELTNDDIKSIVDSMNEAKKYPDGSYEQRMMIAKIQQRIADKMPKTLRDKILGLQRISLILNPKTLVTRNPLSNVLLHSLESVRENTVGAMVDAVTSGARKSERTTMFAPIEKGKAYKSGVQKGLQEWGKDIKYGVDTAVSRGQLEMPRGKTYNEGGLIAKLTNNKIDIGKTLNSVDTFTKNALQIGDRPFYQGAYDSRIAELKIIKKTKEATPEMELDARMYALDKVFQNDSELSKRAKQLKNSLGILGDIAMPFTQTPANVFDKLLDYSPAGVGKALYHLGKTKGGESFNQKLFVDRVSRSLTGGGIILLGYAMAAKGFATGDDEKNKRVREFKRTAGSQMYAFKFGDKYYTFDWMQPIGGLLAAGADAYFGGKDKKSFIESISKGTESAVNTMFKQSFLQGMLNMLSGYSPAVGLGKTIMSAPLQATPTAGKQVTQLFDPYVRDTRGKNVLDETGKKMLSRIPFASKTLPEKVDVFGEPVKYFQGRNNLFNVMLNPGFYSELKKDPATKMILGLYERTKNNDVLPRVSPEKITHNNETIQLTLEEQRGFQKSMGQKLLLSLNLYAPKSRSKMDDENIKEIKRLIDQAYDKAKEEFIRGKGLPLKLPGKKKSKSNLMGWS